jgi:hypothetical protein
MLRKRKGQPSYAVWKGLRLERLIFPDLLAEISRLGLGNRRKSRQCECLEREEK